MDYFRGFRVFREDPQWTMKLLVASLLMLSTAIIPIVGQVAMLGWHALLVRSIVHGRITPMPRLEFDMDYLVKLLGIGFKPFIVQFVWTLPVMAVAFGFCCCGYFGMFAVAAGALEGGGSGATVAAIAILAIGSILFFLLLIVASIPAAVGMLRAELTDQINEGLQFRAVLDFTKAMFRELLVGTLLLGLAGFGLMIVGLLACYVGIFPAMSIAMIASAHFLAQVYQRWLEKGGAPLYVAPSEPV